MNDQSIILYKNYSNKNKVKLYDINIIKFNNKENISVRKK